VSATNGGATPEQGRYEPPSVVDITREEYLRRIAEVSGGRAR
jgi:hypothetical protein